jgi:hypothetical protein
MRRARENVVLPNRIDNDRLRRLQKTKMVLASAQPISPALISYLPAHTLAHLGGRTCWNMGRELKSTECLENNKLEVETRKLSRQAILHDIFGAFG